MSRPPAAETGESRVPPDLLAAPGSSETGYLAALSPMAGAGALNRGLSFLGPQTILPNQTLPGTITLPGMKPRAVAVWEAGNAVFVADQATGNLYKFNATTLAPSGFVSVGTGVWQYGLVVDEATGKVFAASHTRQKVAVVNGADCTLIQDLAGTYSNFPRLAIDSGSGKVWALSLEGLRQIDIGALTETTIAGFGGGGIEELAVNTVTHKAFVTRFIQNTVVIVDGTTLGTTTVSGMGGAGIIANTVENKVVVATGSGGAGVAYKIYDVDTGVQTNLSGVNDALNLAFNPTSSRVHTTSEVNKFSTIINGVTDAWVNIPLLGGSNGVGVRNASGHAYHAFKQSIAVVDEATETVEMIPVTNPTPSSSNLYQDVSVNQSTGRVFVIPDGDALNSVIVIDDTTMLLRPPVYLASVGSSRIHVYDPASDTVVSTITPSVGTLGEIIAVRPGGGRYYVGRIFFFNPELSVYAGVGSSALLTFVDTGANDNDAPRIPAARPSDGRIYATRGPVDDVVVIDPVSSSVVTSIAVGDNPRGLAFTPDGAKLYVANQSSNNVSVINAATNTVSTTIAVGAAPYGVVLLPNGRKAYVANSSAGTVSVINTTTDTVSGTLTVGATPHWLAASPDGLRVYVGNRGGGSVSVIDTSNDSVTTPVTGLLNPEGIAVLPDNSKVYVVNSNTSAASALTAINPATYSTTSIALPSNSVTTIGVAIADPTSRFAGRVTNNSGGAPISGALIRALQSGVEKGTAISNAAGDYSIFNLLPGTYDLEASATGFTTQNLAAQAVSAGRTEVRNFALDGPPSFAIDDVTHSEGQAGTTSYTFTVTRTGSTTLNTSVNFTTVDGTATTADNDYQANSGVLNFAPADTTKTITVLVNGDATLESDEAFTVHLSGASNATISDADGTGTITNDDGSPAFVIDDVSHVEGNAGTTAYTFTVSKSGSTALNASVNFTTVDGTATTADSDYQAQSGALTFLPADTTKTITVLVNGDTTFEADETFTVHLSGASNATISDADGAGTITNDDAAPPSLWSQANSGTSNNLFSVHFVSPTVGWAVGASNTILHTPDGGANWTAQSNQGSVPSSSYLGVRFLDASTGWAGGGSAILRTTDGGLSWAEQGATPDGRFRNNLFAVSASVAWLPAQSAGSRWFSRFTVGVGEQNFNVIASSAQYFDIYFTDADNGWAVGSGPVVRITNASSASPGFSFLTSPPFPTLNGIYMLDASTGWAVGNGGLIEKTTNGGATWTVQASGTTNHLKSVHFVDANRGWAVGAAGTILMTSDGGGTWVMESSGVSVELRRVYFVNANVGYAVGLNGTILKRFVCEAPAITTEPSAQAVCAGQTATFTVTAANAVSYQWRKNGVAIGGATSSSYTTPPTLPADNGALYSVVVTGACGSPVTSNDATLTVNSYTLSASAASFPDSGGNGSVDVTVAGSCAWTAVSNDAWITITSGTPGSGNGTVNYTVASNTGAARSGTMTIAGQTFTVNQSAPTAIELLSLSATGYDKGTLIEWRTGAEVSNLGFRLYREAAGKRELITPQLIAGAALKAGADLRSGEAYAWWDAANGQAARYWLEDIDLAGQSTWHGPFFTQSGGGTAPARAQSLALAALGQAASSGQATRLVEPAPAVRRSSSAQSSTQASLAGQATLKISIRREGWYRVTFAELAAAGFNTTSDSRFWQLFAGAEEVPLLITKTSGKGSGFDSTAAVEFYGAGLDTPATDTHTYWLVSGSQPGRRLEAVKGGGVASTATSFMQTVERRDRTIYFAALRNGEAENFFGAVLSNQPLEQIIELRHPDLTTAQRAVVDVRLQGVTSLPHRVAVQLNDSDLGELTFSGQQQGVLRVEVAASLLREGSNRLRLLSAGGAGDVSLVDRIRISYPHTFAADDDALVLNVNGGQGVTIKGFSSAMIRGFDVTDQNEPREIVGEISGGKDGYQISVAAEGSGLRRLLLMSAERMSRDAALVLNVPSGWRTPKHEADLLIVTRRDFFEALQPLVALREAEGLKVALVDIEDVFDEFNYGDRSPQAVKDFLAYTQTQWAGRPRYLLLAGDASYDARNYLGYGSNDLLPTKLVDTDYLETMSDDWLSDFDGDGISDIAMGRLPVRTAAEVAAVVAKLLRYEQTVTPAAALLVSDRNEGYDFEAASASLRGLLGGLRIDELRRGQMETEAARKALYAALSSGERLVNYVGHGSATGWNGGLFEAGEAEGLTNAALPVFVLMNCLNGYFADPGNDALGEALVKAPHGGAIAAWASSGMTLPEAQAAIDQAFYRLLLESGLRGAQGLTLGEAARQAKRMTADRDVRRTWTLLGDPSMRLR